LKSFEEEEPVLRLRRLMKEAIAEERFEVFSFCISPNVDCEFLGLILDFKFGKLEF